MPNWISSVSPAVNVRNFAQTESRRLQSARPSYQTYRSAGHQKTTAVKKEPVDRGRPRMIGRSKSAKPILQCSEELVMPKKTHHSSPAIIPLSHNQDPNNSVLVRFSNAQKVHPIPKRTKSNKRLVHARFRLIRFPPWKFHGWCNNFLT